MTVIEKIKTINDDNILILSPEIMAELGLTSGDEVEVTVNNGTIVMRPVEDDDDAEFDAIADQLIEERKHVYEALARGAE